MVRGRATAGRPRRDAGQLDRRQHHGRQGPRHLQQRFRDLAARDARHRRRDRGLRQGQMEDRERKLQRSQVQRLPPRAQLRPRQAEPRHDVRRHEPARLRTPYGLRLPRTALDQGQNRQTSAHPLLRAHQDHHGLSRLSRLDDADADPDRLKTAAPCRGPTRTMMSVQRSGQLELLCLEYIPYFGKWLRFQLFWAGSDGFHASLQVDPDWPRPDVSLNEANHKMRELIVDYVRKELNGDEALLAKVVPGYPPYGK